jgi:inhibitor of KinA
MDATHITLQPLGDSALRVGFGSEVDPQVSAQVQALARQLRQAPLPGQRDVVPAYTTLTLHYRPEAVAGDADDLRPPCERLAEQLRAALARTRAGAQLSGREIVVPVLYGGEAGPDLAAVASHCGLSEAEVIALHTASPHQVCMLGFAPGFPFITGLEARLRTARRATPRTHIPPGSVAIAREQTCIYPLDTPGGWNLIGRTPLALFDAQATPPSLLRAGDRLHFEPIDAARFAVLQAQADAPAPRRARRSRSLSA